MSFQRYAGPVISPLILGLLMLGQYVPDVPGGFTDERLIPPAEMVRRFGPSATGSPDAPQDRALLAQVAQNRLALVEARRGARIVEFAAILTKGIADCDRLATPNEDCFALFGEGSSYQWSPLDLRDQARRRREQLKSAFDLGEIASHIAKRPDVSAINKARAFYYSDRSSIASRAPEAIPFLKSEVERADFSTRPARDRAYILAVLGDSMRLDYQHRFDRRIALSYIDRALDVAREDRSIDAQWLFKVKRVRGFILPLVGRSRDALRYVRRLERDPGFPDKSEERYYFYRDLEAACFPRSCELTYKAKALKTQFEDLPADSMWGIDASNDYAELMIDEGKWREARRALRFSVRAMTGWLDRESRYDRMQQLTLARLHSVFRRSVRVNWQIGSAKRTAEAR